MKKLILAVLLITLLAAACNAPAEEPNVKALTTEQSPTTLPKEETPKPIPEPTPKQEKPSPPKIESHKQPNCDPNYSGCVPVASDVDCAGGSGNGPAYVRGPVRVTGSDIYDLDRDNDGVACE